jgi:hypothetical protein
MKKVALLVLVVIGFCFAQEGVIGSGGKRPDPQQLASMADWYTWKALGDISALGSVVTVSTTWPGYLLKGFYNPRRDSSVYIHCITSVGDTVKISVPTESSSGKLPIISKILTATSTDSTIACFQKR